MARRGPWHAAAAAAAAIALTAPPARGAAAVVSPDGRVAWRLGASGAIEQVSLDDGRVTSAAGLPPVTALAGPIGDRLFALSPLPEERSTALLAIPAAALNAVNAAQQWQVRGMGRFLEVTPDGAIACVVAERGSGWSLNVLDLRAAGSAPRTVALSSAPQAVALMPDPGAAGGHRLVVATSGRLTTFTLDPPAPSWFYQSPGDHRAVRPLGAARALMALRGSDLAFFEPDLRPRDNGRVRLTEDDATRVVPLSAPGEDLRAPAGPPSMPGAPATGQDAAAGVAVLHEGGTALSWIDPRDGRVVETRELSPARLMLARGGEVVLVAAASQAGAAAPDRAAVDVAAPPLLPALPAEQIVTRLVEAAMKEPGPHRAGIPPPSPPPDGKPPRSSQPATPPAALPAPAQDANGPAPEEKPPAPAASPIQPPPPASEPASEPAQPSAAPPPAAAREDAAPFLSGRVAGDADGLARDVLVYGPGNILKLHARMPIEPGGTFRLPLPPPGTYRILVAPRAGSHLFTRPEFRTVVVQPGEGGIAGIDFEVRGAL